MNNIPNTKTLDFYFANRHILSEVERIKLRKDISKSLHDKLRRKAQKINIVSAACGTGKTTALANYVAENYHLTNILVAFPTTKLLEQFEEALLKIQGSLGYVFSFEKITSKTAPKKVSKTIQDRITHSDEHGSILLVTHQGWLGMKSFPEKWNWKVFIDEVPDIDDWVPFKLPEHPQFLKDYIQVVKQVNKPDARPLYLVKVIPEKKHELQQIVDGEEDDVKDKFIRLYRALLSKYCEVFIDKDVSGEHKAFSSVSFLLMRTHKQFIGCTVLSANIEESLFYLWFEEKYNSMFCDFQAITENLKVLPEKEVTIYYYCKNNYSKSLRDSGIPSFGECVDELIKSLAGDEKWLYVSNKDWNFSYWNFMNIRPKSHGINSYMDCTNIAFNYSENRTPSHYRMLESLNLPADEVKQATYHQTIYQAAFRTELRDPLKDSGCNFIVPDKRVAEYLNSKLGNKVKIIDVSDCLPHKHPMDKSQKNARYRLKQKLKKIESSNITVASLKQSDFAVNLHSRENSFLYREDSLNRLFRALTSFSKVTLVEGEQSYISAEIYESGEFKQANVLIFEFIDIDLSPEQFIEIFWNSSNGTKHTFLICNSWTRSDENPNRFMVFMPTNRKMSSEAEVRQVREYVLGCLLDYKALKINSNEWFDATKRYALPAINIEHSSVAFQKSFGTEKNLVDVDLIAKKSTSRML